MTLTRPRLLLVLCFRVVLLAAMLIKHDRYFKSSDYLAVLLCKHLCRNASHSCKSVDASHSAKSKNAGWPGRLTRASIIFLQDWFGYRQQPHQFYYKCCCTWGLIKQLIILAKRGRQLPHNRPYISGNRQYSPRYKDLPWLTVGIATYPPNLH